MTGDWSWQRICRPSNSKISRQLGQSGQSRAHHDETILTAVVPDPGELTEQDSALLAEIDAGFEVVGALYDACNFRTAVRECMRLSTLANQYLEATSPWVTWKNDLQATAFTLHGIAGDKWLESVVCACFAVYKPATAWIACGWSAFRPTNGDGVCGVQPGAYCADV